MQPRPGSRWYTSPAVKHTAPYALVHNNENCQVHWGYGGGRCWVRTSVGLTDGFTGDSQARLRKAFNLHERCPNASQPMCSTALQPKLRSAGPAMSGWR